MFPICSETPGEGAAETKKKGKGKRQREGIRVDAESEIWTRTSEGRLERRKQLLVRIPLG